MYKSAYACYQNLATKLDEINRFIDLLEEQRNFILTHSDDKSQYLQLLRQTNHSSITYNAIIIGIYGAFEYYIDALFGDFLVFRKNTGWELSEKEKGEYYNTACEFITNPNRYRNYPYTREDVIQNMYEIGCQNTNSALSELMLRHGGNLNFEQTNSLATKIGITTFAASFSSHAKDQQYLSCILSEDLRNELIRSENMTKEKWQDIVEQRNSIAHTGNVDNRYAPAMLKNYVQVFKAIGIIVLHTVLEIMASRLIESGCMKAFTPVHDVFSNHILATDLGDQPINTADLIVSRNSKGQCKVLRIESIQVNSVPVSTVDVPGTTLCMKVDKSIRDTQDFYYFPLSFSSASPTLPVES